MQTLFDIPPEPPKKLRESRGRFCTKEQLEIDRKYRSVAKYEQRIIQLEKKVEYWKCTAQSLQRMFIIQERLKAKK